MRFSVVFVCLAATAVAFPTHIIMGSSDAGGSAIGVEESTEHSLADTVHTIPNPEDGSLMIWQCGDRSLFGGKIMCIERDGFASPRAQRSSGALERIATALDATLVVSKKQ
ncbi:hypothetical protein NLG97_g9947 [Lecanicillium saksenae]|uniref:Uncharacterized protein n=1 Tax=Lecanicillium saksenae TaxID=468837 RepID=A0ACC1QF39_9HYPO|nr:hypothetical protein NLG97_g9947 [Lecanicillium saksenae]